MTTAPDRAGEELTVRETVPSAREWLTTFLIGLCMGTADAVPGVSGGTIALIAGIYERLIAAITAVTPDRILGFLGAFVPIDDGIEANRALAVWEAVDGWFLVTLLAGIVTAVAIVTRVVHVLDRAAPIVLFGFFFGLIAASAVILARAITIARPDSAAAALIGFLLAFFVSGVTDELFGGGLGIVFLAGAIGVSAMILPGISGSLLLVILGQYTRMSSVLSEFIDGVIGLVSGGSLTPVIENGRIVVTFVVGGLVGLFTISRLIRRALERNRQATLAFLVALIVGALRAPIATLNGPDYDVTWTGETIAAFAGLAAVGAVVVLALDWYAVDIDLETA